MSYLLFPRNCSLALFFCSFVLEVSTNMQGTVFRHVVRARLQWGTPSMMHSTAILAIKFSVVVMVTHLFLILCSHRRGQLFSWTRPRKSLHRCGKGRPGTESHQKHVADCFYIAKWSVVIVHSLLCRDSQARTGHSTHSMCFPYLFAIPA